MSFVLLQTPSASLAHSDSGDVPEDGQNPPSNCTTESSFTDFVHYSQDGPQAERVLQPNPTAKTGCRSSGSSQTKTVDKPVMQCCLEHFQQFLSRLISLYIIPGHSDGADCAKTEILHSGPVVSKGLQHSGYSESLSEPGLVQRERVAAFTAACQLFLECSSFPVYIAEGNLKSSTTQMEQFGRMTKMKTLPLMLIISLHVIGPIFRIKLN